jgi:hypothetical protein
MMRPTNYRYLMSCSAYLPEPEDALCIEVAHAIYTKVGCLSLNRRE